MQRSRHRSDCYNFGCSVGMLTVEFMKGISGVRLAPSEALLCRLWPSRNEMSFRTWPAR